jgi:hypothetical protein
MFYLCGEEKFVTIVGLIRNTNNFHVTTFDFQSKRNLCAFEIFPVLGTILTVDEYN